MSAGDPGARRWLAGALLALAALYGAWFWPGADRWAALALFALPPLAMAARLLRGDAPRLRFWAVASRWRRWRWRWRWCSRPTCRACARVSAVAAPAPVPAVCASRVLAGRVL
jgi:hypothetical protein